MIITVPRALIIGLGAVFSAYHLILAWVSLSIPDEPGPIIAAMVIYAAATTASLLPSRSPRMPLWLAASNVVASIAITLLVTSQLPNGPGDSYAAWHTAAIGTLMVITSTRRRQAFAWVGVGAVAAQTLAWQGLTQFGALGSVGSLVWVGISHALAYSLAAAARDARQYALAEREAAEWRAAQEAHVFERQFRLGQTGRMATPMLRQIVASGGNLTDAERQECLYLEGAIRDEIRGRSLLNDRVRAAVMAARRRGTTVTLLDEGGIDDLPVGDHDRVLDRIAAAVEETRTDRIVVRTVPIGSDVAVTVVGLSSVNNGVHSLLGHEPEEDEDDGDEIDLWLEIPRTQADALRG